MRTNNPALSYQQAAARGATPIAQIVALYDTILRDFARALAALQAGNAETRVFELNHALLVIAHLQSVLDHDRGGEAAKRFEEFYNVTRGMIVEANIKATPEPLEKLIELYRDLRQAWHQAEEQLPANQPIESSTTPPRDSAEIRAASPATTGAETAQLQWSA